MKLTPRSLTTPASAPRLSPRMPTTPAAPPEDDGEPLGPEQDAQVAQIERVAGSFQQRGDAYQREKEEEFYFVVVLKSAAQRDALLAHLGQPLERFVNGLDVARRVGASLPPEHDLPERKPQPRWAELVKP